MHTALGAMSACSMHSNISSITEIQIYSRKLSSGHKFLLQ